MDEANAGIGILSEEQTNLAMEAIEQTVTEKRQNSEDAEEPAAKRLRPNTRIPFSERLRQLKAYKEEHGDLNIPIRYKQNPSLGKFVHNTREQYKIFHNQVPPTYRKRCSLTAERIRQLDEIGFIWSCERQKKHQDDWNSRFDQLKDYKEKHGHCNVPHGYPEDPPFAEWIHRQRTTYAAMQKKPQPNMEERMERLKELGFSFTVHDDKWMDHWDMLQVYKERFGDSRVPTHFAENPRLGRWVHTQRHQRRLLEKGKRSTMTEERIKKLNELDFPWSVRSPLERPRVSWMDQFEELKKYMKKHGNCMIEPGPLHAWCVEQRARLRSVDKNGKDGSGRMADDRVQMLKDIGFDKDTYLPGDVSLDDNLNDPVPEETSEMATI